MASFLYLLIVLISLWGMKASVKLREPFAFIVFIFTCAIGTVEIFLEWGIWNV